MRTSEINVLRALIVYDFISRYKMVNFESLKDNKLMKFVSLWNE